MPDMVNEDALLVKQSLSHVNYHIIMTTKNLVLKALSGKLPLFTCELISINITLITEPHDIHGK